MYYLRTVASAISGNYPVLRKASKKWLADIKSVLGTRLNLCKAEVELVPHH